MQRSPIEQSGRPVSSNKPLQAPRGGVDESTPIEELKPQYAQRLRNAVVYEDGIRSRQGTRTWTTAPGGPVESLIQWGGEHAFAGTPSGLYRVAANLVEPAVTVGITTGRWLGTEMSTPGGNFLVAANGFDGVKVYDGVVWKNCPIAGHAYPERLSCPTWHNRRVWFFVRNTLDLAYFEPSMFGGTLKLFPMTGVFNKGGEIRAIGSIKGDNAENMGDMLAILTSNGQVAIYGGHDPQRSETFSKQGTFDLGNPMGWRPMSVIGGELAITTQDGVITIPSKASTRKTARDDEALTQRIRTTFGLGAHSPLSQHWQVIETGAEGGAVIVNLPDRNQAILKNNAWSMLSEVNATAWVDVGLQTIFGTDDGKVKIYGHGSTDDGAPISGEIIHAYQRGTRLMKVTKVRPHIVSPKINPMIGLLEDFRDPKPRYEASRPAVGGVQWDFPMNSPSGPWSHPSMIRRWDWRTTPGRGHALAFLFAWSSSAPLLYRGADLEIATGGNV